YFGFLTPY
ncbi:hypothetical protein LK397_pgp188, partial (chloroplast) [Beta vulgaris subsp. vulgaris]